MRSLVGAASFVLLGGLLLLQICEGRLRHTKHSDYRCSRCPPGWGVSRPCRQSEDTLCERCTTGYYSPHHSYRSPCWPCSKCGRGLYEAHQCHPSGDTVCDSCHRLLTVNRTLYGEKCLTN